MMISRTDAVEKEFNDLKKKNESLHQENAKLQKTVKDLTAKLEAQEAEHNKKGVSQVGSIAHANDRISNL